MAQNIEIGVGAKTGSVESGMKRVDDATSGVADSVREVASASKEATRELERMEAAARRLKSAQTILSRDAGRPISQGDAATFLGNFDRMRSSRNAGARRLRAYDDFEGWYNGHSSSYARPQDAANHRRFIMSAGMQGTDDSRNYGAPPPGGGDDEDENEPNGGGGGGRGRGRAPPPGGGFDRGVSRARSMAFGFVKGGLALAGINSVMGMASSALDSATEESTGIDTLKRRMGDLGVDFTKLREQARLAGSGLGITYVESQRLAQHYAREAGNLGAGSNLSGVRAGVGFSRAYGLDPEQGVQFFGSMRRLGVGTDESSQRKLALTIADAVAKGGYGGKADEVLQAVADFSATAARMTFSAPNVGAYASALSNLTATGRPGLDPAGAAGILGTADASIRRGGGYGEAGMNFVYASLRGAASDPLQAKALWSGGMFATTRGTFGPGSSAGDYYRKMGMATPALSDTTNFQRIRGLVNRQIAPRFRAEALQNLMGLSTPQQAMELLGMSDGQLGESERLIGRAGITPKDSSVAGIARVANARSVGDLRGLYNSTMGRGDVSADEKGRLRAALDKGSLDDLKTALVAVIGTKEQAETEGSKTRSSVVELKDELTRVGGSLLNPVNLIRDAVVLLANKVAPGFKEGIEAGRTNARNMSVDWGAKYRANGANFAARLDADIAADRETYNRLKREAGGGPVDLSKIVKPDPRQLQRGNGEERIYQADMARLQALQKLENPASGGASMDTIRDAAGWDRMARLSAIDGRLGMPAGTAARQLWAENRFRTNGSSRAGARGFAQVMPKTQTALEKRLGRKLDPTNEADALVMYEEVMKENLGRFGNVPDALRAYNSGWDRKKWNNDETRGYVSSVMGNTPLPDGATGAVGGSGVNLNLGAPHEIVLRDANTREARGTIVLRPHVQPTAQGGVL